MMCPVCQTVDLRMTDRQGVEIDYCPSCRGVWLDRGELDKLIERTGAAPSRRGYGEREGYGDRREYRGDREYGDRDDREHEGRYHNYPRHSGDEYKRRKRKSFLDDLFDF